MNSPLKARIEDALEIEDVVVAENIIESPTGPDQRNFAVNKRGIVLQFAIPVDETNEGVIEDFIEYIQAAVAEIK